MTFDAVKPRYTLPLAGIEYEIEGNFGLIEAIEYALKDNIISIMVRCPGMAVYEMAKLLSVILASTGKKLTPQAVGSVLLDEVGLTSSDYAMLCLHVHCALRVFIAKPNEREAERTRAGELLGKQAEPSLASPGENTAASV